MTKKGEDLVASALQRELGLSFRGKYELDGWGTVDDHHRLPDGRVLLLEVESAQKHPCTNVLKIWPYLEKHPSLSVILLQVFFPHSPGLTSNRGELGRWLGLRMKELLGDRFSRFEIVLTHEGEPVSGLEVIRKQLG
ncbi:MAG TPA: hypothetical protein VF530_07250 [Planctomycetota bacterium]